MNYSLKIMILIVALSQFWATVSAGRHENIKENHSRYKSSGEKFSVQSDSGVRLTDNQYASLWNITLADWQRYKFLMKGPRGIWSPKLDPLTVLGIHASSEAERRRIALIQVKIEHKRLEKELAYDRTYYQVGREYFGKGMLIDFAKLQHRIDLARKTSIKNQQQVNLQTGDRLLLFVALKSCQPCNQASYYALDRVRGKKGIGVDIFFVGSGSNDKKQIQRWAKHIGISAMAIEQGNVSLNYDSGTFKQLVNGSRKLPLLLHKRGASLAPYIWQ